MNRPLIHCVDIVVFCLSWGVVGLPSVQCLRHPCPDPSMVACKYGGMQVWCKYGASMTQVWCRALAGADRMDRGIMQTCPVLPVPCITAMQCCIVHCCIALRFGELPHPSTRLHWSTQLCLELHSAQPLCCLHYWMKVMICVLKYVVFMDFFNEHF